MMKSSFFLSKLDNCTYYYYYYIIKVYMCWAFPTITMNLDKTALGRCQEKYIKFLYWGIYLSLVSSSIVVLPHMAFITIIQSENDKEMDYCGSSHIQKKKVVSLKPNKYFKRYLPLIVFRHFEATNDSRGTLIYEPQKIGRIFPNRNNAFFLTFPTIWSHFTNHLIYWQIKVY